MPKAMSFRIHSIKKSVVNTMFRYFRTSSYASEAPLYWEHTKIYENARSRRTIYIYI